jgi:thiosulfate dehydrogenase [quinone] large subunit
MAKRSIEVSSLSYFFIADKRIAWLWLVVRLYLAWEWLQAGWEKVHDPAWVGSQAGTALTGFIQGALAKTSGAHPDVQGWYAWFLTHAVATHVLAWSYLVAYGEVLVGVALLLGFLTGISVLFGMLMNLDYLLAGSVSLNPQMFILGVGVALAWRVSGYIGLDRYVLPVVHNFLQPNSRT